MNRKDLVDELSRRFEGNREVAAQALDSVVDVITKSVSAGERVVISGFGEFDRKARDAGAKAGEYVPEFKPGKELRDVVSGAREWRDRVSQSLAVVPATAADAADQASRATAGTLRSVAAKARELAAELSEIGEPDDAAAPGGAQPGTATKKAPAKKNAAKKAPARTSTAKKAPAKTSTAKKAPAKTSTAKKTPAKTSTATKAPAKKSAAKKTTTSRPTKKATSGTSP